MTLSRSYENATQRNIFRLRELADRPGHAHDLACDSPTKYTDLSEREKISVAEFIEFLLHRDEKTGDDRENFYMRDHGNRPITREHPIGEKTPASYADLGEEDRFHVCEFIAFLIIRRRDGKASEMSGQ